MSFKSIMHQMKSVVLTYQGDFISDDPALQQAVIGKLLKKSAFAEEESPGHYRAGIKYGDDMLLMKVSGTETPKGFRVDVQVTAENARKAAALDKPFQKVIRGAFQEAGGTFKNKTSSVSIL